MTQVNPPPMAIFPQHNPYTPGSKEWRFANDLITANRQLQIVIEQLWRRTGGGEDIIQNIEVTQVVEDGGNRTFRRHRDEIDDIHGHLAELKKPKDNREEIDRLESAINELKRPKDHTDDIGHILDALAEVKRASRSIDQRLFELEDIINQTKRKQSANEYNVFQIHEELVQTRRVNRSTEQQLNELIERVDSGV